MNNDIATAGNKIFDRCHANSTDTSDLVEQLVCAAALEFFRARDVVTHLHTFDARVFGRFDAVAALRMVDLAVEALAKRATDYRSTTLDDMGHLALQTERAVAAPRLEMARYLLGMAANVAAVAA